MHRRLQFDDSPNRDDEDEERNWVRRKAFDGSTPLGPVVAAPETLLDDTSTELRVTGDRRQASSPTDVILAIPGLVDGITTYVTPEPGDVIAAGTPEGVAFLSDGDHVAVATEIGRVTTLELPVRQDRSGPGRVEYSLDLP